VHPQCWLNWTQMANTARKLIQPDCTPWFTNHVTICIQGLPAWPGPLMRISPGAMRWTARRISTNVYFYPTWRTMSGSASPTNGCTHRAWRRHSLALGTISCPWWGWPIGVTPWQVPWPDPHGFMGSNGSTEFIHVDRHVPQSGD
jgi:hypothetical protein